MKKGIVTDPHLLYRAQTDENRMALRVGVESSIIYAFDVNIILTTGSDTVDL